MKILHAMRLLVMAVALAAAFLIFVDHPRVFTQPCASTTVQVASGTNGDRGV